MMPQARVAERLAASGSTRQVALMRISLATVLWASWGYPFILHFDLHPDRVLLALSFYLASLLLFVGRWTRFATVWVAVTLGVALWHLGEADASTIWSKQHRQLTFVMTLLLALTPSGKSFSLDRWRSIRRARADKRPIPAEAGPLWGVVGIRLFAGLVLAFTTLWLLQSDWISGVYVEAAFFDGQGAELSARLGSRGWARALAALLVGAHLFTAVGVWFRRTRTHAVVTGTATYALIFILTPLDTLALVVAWLLFSFLPADGVHRTIDRLHAHDPGAP
jgi:hypothetical protein